MRSILKPLRETGRLLLPMLVSLFLVLATGLSASAYTDLLDTPSFKTEGVIYSLLIDVTKAGDRLVAVGERGHILFSDDQGQNWTQADVPSMAHLTAVHFPTPEKGWAVGDDAVILHSADGGKSWVHQYDDRENSFPAPALDVFFFDETTGYVIGAYGMMLRTADGGQNWEEWRDAVDNIDEWHYNGFDVSPEGVLWIAGEAGFVYRSVDKGETWETLDAPHDASFMGLVCGREEGLVVAFGTGGRVFRTLDNGETWESIEPLTESGYTAGTLLEDGSFLVVGQDGVLLKGDPQAENFVHYSREDRMPLSSVISTGNGNFMAVGFFGVHHMNTDVFTSSTAAEGSAQ